MPTLSTTSRALPNAIQVGVITAFFLALCGLLAYLATGSIPAGDGVVYLDQVLGGNLRERTLHLGYLFQLAALAALFGDTAAPLLSALWAVAAWIAAWWGAGALLGDADPTRRRLLALAAPAFLAALIPFWEHALFAEVYGPAAAALLWAAALRLRGRDLGSAAAVGLAAAIHPGSLAWLPALALMGPRRLRYAAIASLFPAALAVVFFGDYVLGGRGVLASLEWPQPWRASQRAWRALVWGASVIAALPILGLLDGRTRRRLLLPLTAGIAAAVLTDWYRDVPAYLPALYLLALAAPVGVEVLSRGGAGRQRAVFVGAAVVLAFQIGEATSHQDRLRRALDREVAALQALDAPDPPLPWGSFGERARYRHYVPQAVGPRHVALPLGDPFDRGICPDQTPRIVGDLQVFVCPSDPLVR